MTVNGQFVGTVVYTIPANLDKSYFAIFGLILFSYITIISNAYSFPLISQSDTLSINEMIMILKIICQFVVKYVMLLPIKTIMSVLNVSTYIMISITTNPTRLSVKTFITALLLCISIVLMFVIKSNLSGYCLSIKLEILKEGAGLSLQLGLNNLIISFWLRNVLATYIILQEDKYIFNLNIPWKGDQFKSTTAWIKFNISWYIIDLIRNDVKFVSSAKTPINHWLKKYIFIFFFFLMIFEGLSWWWSYGSWIYNY